MALAEQASFQLDSSSLFASSGLMRLTIYHGRSIRMTQQALKLVFSRRQYRETPATDLSSLPWLPGPWMRLAWVQLFHEQIWAHLSLQHVLVLNLVWKRPLR